MTDVNWIDHRVEEENLLLKPKELQVLQKYLARGTVADPPFPALTNLRLSALLTPSTSFEAVLNKLSPLDSLELHLAGDRCHRFSLFFDWMLGYLVQSPHYTLRKLRLEIPQFEDDNPDINRLELKHLKHLVNLQHVFVSAYSLYQQVLPVTEFLPESLKTITLTGIDADDDESIFQQYIYMSQTTAYMLFLAE